MNQTTRFHLRAPYQPAGDQPAAIRQLTSGLVSGDAHQTLLGVTGSGKTFTIANVVAEVQRPALVLAHNKTLAAQLTQEFRTFFPDAAVEYFVSYYDYYQPEAYLAASDTYIEKEVEINDEIDRLRHAATAAVLARTDVIVVASVSAIYGLGSPDMYRATILELGRGQMLDREMLTSRLVDMYFGRSQTPLRGTFSVRGGTVDIVPPGQERIIRVRLEGDQIASLEVLDLVTRAVLETLEHLTIFPAKHFVVGPDQLSRALQSIEAELALQVASFERSGKLLEADRLLRRTKHDLALLRELGYCNGIENYSRHLTGRQPGEAPDTLIDYFPDDFVTVIDESHVTVPQLGAMYEGDRARKQSLIDFGFRLPSALDNRPLKFVEFEQRTPQRIYVSATPGPYERQHSSQVVEQLIRPTGLVDPALEVRPVTGQVDDAIAQIAREVAQGNRVLVTTLTKKMAEDLAEHLKTAGPKTGGFQPERLPAGEAGSRRMINPPKATYLHSSVETIDRIRTLQRLRRGELDVVVGVNLLREGLDLPEVSLVLILDADKEGFLRSETSLIQTIGRAARNIRGRVILYADGVTGSMRRAIAETERRRARQQAYNTEHGITPESIRKQALSILPEEETAPAPDVQRPIDPEQLPAMIRERERTMKQLARDLRFEEATLVRDEVIALRKLHRTVPVA